MAVSFVHCSDLHLGYEQYGHEQRFHDFGNSARQIVDYAIENQVDYFVIAGDLFNKRSINSRTLTQAIALLERLKQAGISVIAIEGNHDKAPYGDYDSWMWFLNKQGYLYLLAPEFEDGNLSLTEWNKETGIGMAASFPEIRFIGMGYQGSMMARRVSELAEQLTDSHGPTVVLMHSAVDHLLHLGGVRTEDIEPLRGRVDYIAMGHVHRRYELDNWVFNPGSPECWDLGEAEEEKGFYHVMMDEGQAPVVRHIRSVRRAVVSCRVNLSDCVTLDEVYGLCAASAQDAVPDAEQQPIVRLILEGKVPFSPLSIDTRRLEEDTAAQFGCLLVEVVNNVLMMGQERLESDGQEVNREYLERQVLRDLLAQDGTVQPWVDELVQISQHVKDLLGRETDDESVAKVIEGLAAKIVETELACEDQALELVGAQTAASKEAERGEPSEDS